MSFFDATKTYQSSARFSFPIIAASVYIVLSPKTLSRKAIMVAWQLDFLGHAFLKNNAPGTA